MRRYRARRAWVWAFGLLLASADADAAVPDRVWGTYIGGNLGEFSLVVAVDGAGDVYVAGETGSDEGIATAGAHKSVRQGNDGFLLKFDADGKQLWGTYYGGVGSDDILAIAVTDFGVVVAGRSHSPDGIATPGSHQPVAGGMADGFLAAFASDGARLWGTYLGSNSGEYAETVAVDVDGTILVGGTANGPLPGLGTPGTHQPLKAAGQDGYIARFTPEGALVWGTYYGGAKADNVSVVAPGPLGDVYVAGRTRSSDGIASPGAHDVALAKDDDIDELSDNDDAFLVRLAGDGTRVWGTYYGDLGFDGIEGLAPQPGGGVIIAGATNSKTTIATADAFQPEFASGVDYLLDAFLARFDAEGARAWGTYLGGTDNDQGDALAMDKTGAVYLLGIVASPGLATAEAFATTPPGTNDALVSRFTPDGARSWSSYYGGPGNDLPRGIAVAGDRIYVTGSSSSSSGISTPGAHLEQLNVEFIVDGFLARFSQGGGDSCARAEDCFGGMCVDGVCCDSTCDGACEVCSAALGARADGTCTPLAADVVCRPASGTCDVAELCPGDAAGCPDDAAVPDGEPCDDGTCMAGACEPPPGSTSGDTTGSSTSTSGTGTGTGSGSGAGSGDGDGTITPTGEVPTTSGVGDASSSSSSSTGGPAGDGEGGCQCRAAGAPVLPGLEGLLVLAALRRRRRASI